MKLIVGLGNPGILYHNSRHNAGFLVVKKLAKENACSLKRDAIAKSFVGKLEIGGEQCILMLPLTYMNLSGLAVRNIVNRYKIDSENILVVCDDIDLEFGRIRVRAQGSSGGHRGLESVIKELETRQISRLRVGVGRPGSEKPDISRYVLSGFKNKELQQLKEIIVSAAQYALLWAVEGITKTMNTCNASSVKS